MVCIPYRENKICLSVSLSPIPALLAYVLPHYQVLQSTTTTTKKGAWSAFSCQFFLDNVLMAFLKLLV